MTILSLIGGDMEAARAPSFRSKFQIKPDRPYTLKDEEIARIHFFSEPSKGGIILIDKRGEGEGEKFKKAVPETIRAHYEKLRIDPRFTRFVLYAKTDRAGTVDAMIVAFAVDDFYYVAAVWDKDGHDIWEPVPGDINTSLVSRT